MANRPDLAVDHNFLYGLKYKKYYRKKGDKMSGFIIIEGTVVGPNIIRHKERDIACYINSMQAAVAPQPLDLSAYMGQVVRVSGNLHGELWSASFENIVLKDGNQQITGKVIGFNNIEYSGSIITCYRHGMEEATYLPLGLYEYMGHTITVSGELYGHELYRADIVSGEELVFDENALKKN